MAKRVGGHIRGNVVAYLALFLALGMGTAWALERNSVRSKHIVNGQVKSADVKNNGLTGRDIKDQSGVDTCVDGTTRVGALCVRATNLSLGWFDAVDYCGDLELRLPSLGEGVALAANHEVPGIDPGQEFWTEEFWDDGTSVLAWAVAPGQSDLTDSGVVTNPRPTICVTTPSS